MDAGDAGAAGSGIQFHLAAFGPCLGPGLAIVATDDERSPVERDGKHAVTGADDVVSEFAAHRKKPRLRPGRSVVRGGADDVLSGMHEDQMEECFVAIPPELRRVVVDVGAIPEGRRCFPVLRAETETAGGVAQLRPGLGDARIPDGEQIAIRTLGDGWAVIVLGKQRTDLSLGYLSIHPWPFEKRHGRILRNDLRRLLADVLCVQGRCWRRQPVSLRQVAEHDAETDVIEAGIRDPTAAICRADHAREHRVAAATEHVKVTDATA